MRGFTLVELLLTIGIFFLLGSFTLPVTISFLQAQTLDDTAREMVGVIRRAEGQAAFGKHDSAYGIRILAGSYVLFEGDSYALRNIPEDEEFQLPNSITTSGLSEITFSKGNGTPNATGTTEMYLGDEQVIISINEYGRIEW